MKIYKDILHADEETTLSNKNSYKSITRGINCFTLLLDFEFRIKMICQFYCRSLLFISREGQSLYLFCRVQASHVLLSVINESDVFRDILNILTVVTSFLLFITGYNMAAIK